ncbi:MAG: peptidase modulator of gyrase [Myxococcales bacterium]|nr:peptidase modulator of gyrase [Myxococcales bacterium]
MLGSLGVASAQALLWACSSRPRPVQHPIEVSGQVRNWLHDAVAKLRAEYPFAHALAVSRRRTTAGIDVLGAGVARGRCDGVVLTVRTREGARREHVTSDLSSTGVDTASRALLSRAVRPATIELGHPQIAPLPFAANQDPRDITDATLLGKVAEMTKRDQELSSRIVYAASLIDIDDANVWSVSEGRDLEQRLVRIRRVLTRVAWNGTRPIVSEASRGWIGGIDAQDLSDAEIANATRGALVLATPSAFEDTERDVLLDPDVAATIIDASARALLTSTALRRPEVARRLAAGGAIASPVITLVDDPAVPGGYGSCYFDDEGEPASKLTLLDAGRVVGRLADRAAVEHESATMAGRGRRPGHIGPIEPAPSNLRLQAGTAAAEDLLDDGYVLQGGLGAVVDAGSDRIVVSVARAIERHGGKDTGRVFADVELVGDFAQLLSSVTAVSITTQTISLRDEIDGQPMWRSIEAPALRLRGMLRARRGPL